MQKMWYTLSVMFMYTARNSYMLLPALLFCLLFTACNEMETVFTTGTVYKVTAQVGDTTIDEAPLITSKDALAPYFITAVAKDPDIRSLTVFLQNSSGQIVMDKVQYALFIPPEDEEPESNLEESAPEENAEIEKQESWTVQKTIDNSLVKTRTVAVESLAEVLPPFFIPDTVPLGQYSLIFQINSEKAVLFTAEKQIYFINDAEFMIDNIQMFLPDFSEQSHLIPVETLLMLQTHIKYDPRLNPYIIWSFNKKEIGKGFVSAGADKILWNVSEKPGFQTLRVELFPFPPQGTIKGKFIELLLPVSAKFKNEGFFAREAQSLRDWYQFRKDLRDSRQTKILAITPEYQSPSWLGVSGIYGIGLGNKTAYSLPMDSFVLRKNEKNTGTLAFYTYFLSDGTFFRAYYRGSSVSVEITLTVQQGKLSLTAKNEDTIRTVALDRFVLGSDGFYTLYYNFTVHDTKLVAHIALKEPFMQSQDIVLEFDEPLERFNAMQLGAKDEEQTVAIIDELAVWFNTPEMAAAQGEPTEHEALTEQEVKQNDLVIAALSIDES
ncbi:MAG: hypothetical protein LBO67_04190 [Spirochaetaceae bacterium]|jgi:hypothetical protein|nr:hypothetical protein [Spirochaetaceae bacterium]